MRAEVPLYSQYIDVENKDWQGKSCGIVALKMLLDYWMDNPNEKPEKFEELIDEGLGYGGYVPGLGWAHKELAIMAKGYGLDGQSFDWSDEHTDIAFNKTVPHLTNHPVMVSIHKDLKEDGPGHLVVLTGYEDGKIFYSDPDSKKRTDVEREASLQKFLKGWTKRIIVIHPSRCSCSKEE
jgi:uncharacterized protein YvpB